MNENKIVCLNMFNLFQFPDVAAEVAEGVTVLILQALDGGFVLLGGGPQPGGDVEAAGRLRRVQRAGEEVGFEGNLGPGEVDRGNEEAAPRRLGLFPAVEPGGGALYLAPVIQPLHLGLRDCVPWVRQVKVKLWFYIFRVNERVWGRLIVILYQQVVVASQCGIGKARRRRVGGGGRSQGKPVGPRRVWGRAGGLPGQRKRLRRHRGIEGGRSSPASSAAAGLRPRVRETLSNTWSGPSIPAP